MGQIVIEALQPEEWQKYKKVRLQALKSDPTAFSNTYYEAIAYPDDKWIKTLVNSQKCEGDIILFAKDGIEVVGMIGAFWNSRPTTKHIANIWGVYVNSNYRGKGVGKCLMNEIIKEIKKNFQFKKIMLGVSTKNIPAIKLYKSNGFETVGTLHKELKFGDNYVDEYLMEKLI